MVSDLTDIASLALGTQGLHEDALQNTEAATSRAALAAVPPAAGIIEVRRPPPGLGGGPEGDLELFLWSVQQTFGYEDVNAATAALLKAMPRGLDEGGSFHNGYNRGTVLGFADGLNEILTTLAWVRDQAFSLLALALDLREFQEALLLALAADFVRDVDPLEGATAAVLASRYPHLIEIARESSLTIELSPELLAFLQEVDKPFLKLLVEVRATILVMFGQALGAELRDFISRFVELKGQPSAQGEMLGRLHGRVAFEIMFELLTSAIKPATAAVRSSKAAVVATQLARNTIDSFPTVRAVFQGFFSLRRSIRAGMSLEKALREAYFDLAGNIASFRRLKYRTGEFNKFYLTLAKLMGWESAGDKIRLDAHHIIEARVVRNLANDPRFADAFKKLGWHDEKDMLAVALETEFHLGKGSTLAKVIDVTDPNIVELESLTEALREKIGPLDRYRSFEELLNRYEEVYRGTLTPKPKKGPPRVIRPLWSLVEPAFKAIRSQLELSTPGT